MRSLKVLTGLMLVWLVLPMGVRAQNTGGPEDPLAKALQQSNVFVGKTMRGTIEENALRALTQSAPADRPLKIAVVSQLPGSGKNLGTRDHYTKALHDYLQLGRGTLIIRTQNGVSAATDAVPAARITQILQQNAPALKNDLFNGLQQSVADLDAAAAELANAAPIGTPSSRDPNNPNNPNQGGQASPALPRNDVSSGGGGGSGAFWWLLPIVGAGGLALWAGKKSAERGQAARQAKLPVERLHGEVVTGISHADTYLDLLPVSAEASGAKSARQQAASLLEQANALTRTARNAADYGRIEAILEQAKAQSQTCRSLIDKATGGTGLAVAVDGTEYKATPFSNGAPATQSAPIVPGVRMEDIPPNERAACFFCSRPARITELTPITIAMNGQRRKVLACAEDVQIIQRGTTPEVRTVAANGQRVPWYTSRSYDPYRDYYGGDVMFVPGYGYGGGVVDGFLFGALMAQPYPMPYPVFVDASGGVTNDFVQAAPPVYADNGYGGGYAPGNDPGSYGYAGNGDNGYANNTANNVPDAGVGGSDFQGNAEAGGAADFSSASSGGADYSTGSVDFGSGGSDFGGGGDY